MDTREVRVVDTFAAEPTGGLPVAVVPDGEDLTTDQLRAVASELAADVTVPVPSEGAPERVRVQRPEWVDEDGPSGTIAPVVAALALEHERGQVEAGSRALSTPAGAREANVTETGRVWVDEEPAPIEAIDLDLQAVADALGIDAAALQDVGADLSSIRVLAGVDALAVPVNFLEHLGDPHLDLTALEEVTRDAEVDVVCAYTFDTLDAQPACHLRALVPGKGASRAAGPELLVTPSIAAGCVSHLVQTGTIEEEQSSVEQGHFVDRPARIDVDVTDGRIGGRAVTGLSGTLSLPAADGDDIIEL